MAAASPQSRPRRRSASTPRCGSTRCRTACRPRRVRLGGWVGGWSPQPVRCGCAPTPPAHLPRWRRLPIHPAHLLPTHPSPEGVFNDSFWEGLGCVVNALDNVNARCACRSSGCPLCASSPRTLLWVACCCARLHVVSRLNTLPTLLHAACMWTRAACTLGARCLRAARWAPSATRRQGVSRRRGRGGGGRAVDTPARCFDAEALLTESVGYGIRVPAMMPSAPPCPPPAHAWCVQMVIPRLTENYGEIRQPWHHQRLRLIALTPRVDRGLPLATPVRRCVARPS